MLAASAVLCGCGGGESNGRGAEPAPNTLLPDGPTREFIVSGGDNTIQLYGREASKAEREAASAVVEAWDRARATEDWQEDCRYLSRSYTDTVVTDAERVSKGKATSCVQALAFFGPVASGDMGRTTTGPIDSLRLAQGIGYAQYHGRDGIDWIVPLKKEDGAWKVEVTTPVDRLG
jgi:hypothetical protein